MKGKQITGFSVAFVREAVEGKVLRLSARAGEQEAFVAGCHDRGTCFEGRITWTAEAAGDAPAETAPFRDGEPDGATP